MDERILKLQDETEQLARTLAEQTGRLREAIEDLQKDYALAQEAESLRETSATLHTRVTTLTGKTTDLEAQIEQMRSEGELLRQGIVRYAIACGTVDVKTAMMHRGATTIDDPQVRADIQKAVKEEQDASEVLRQLARQIQESGRAR